ncbi:MAG: phosphatase PAP2 family protein [Candidatus Aminicenantes bacterium]|nr:phosphatase PAP2 family protein [Candidatus Aminicenantes bacterium]
MANNLLAQNRPFPYELKKRDFWLLPLSIGLSTLGDSLSDKAGGITLEEIRSLDRNDVNAFDRSATDNWSLEWDERSDRYRDTLAVATLFSLSVAPILHAKLSHTATVAVMFTESFFLLRGVTYLTKAAVGRYRPYLYNTTLSAEERFGIDVEEASRSFYSGHTAVAFFGATFLSKVFEDIHGPSLWSKLLWGLSLTLVSLTGLARVKSGMHFPSDVIAGAVVGFAVGYFVPALHKIRKGDKLRIDVSPNRLCVCLRF